MVGISTGALVLVWTLVLVGIFARTLVSVGIFARALVLVGISTGTWVLAGISIGVLVLVGILARTLFFRFVVHFGRQHSNAPIARYAPMRPRDSNTPVGCQCARGTPMRLWNSNAPVGWPCNWAR